MTDASAPLRLAPATDGGPVGPVMVIGGAEDKLGERVILSRFVQLAGGAQAHIVVISTASSLGGAVLDAHGRGIVVAGTSAGASAVATHMMAFGSSGATPKHRMAHVSVGLGLLVNVVVDQHFEQRTRLGRLLAVVAQSPSLIGLGLDEDTAAIIDANDILEVIGRGSVTIVDGSDVITDAFQTTGHKPMMVSNARLHSLPSGYRFDLRARRVLPLDDSKTERIAQLAQGRVARMVRQAAAEGRDDRALQRRRVRNEEQKASE